jgi:3-methyl-2-oxobutanoate hydroxymethyltransferase
VTDPQAATDRGTRWSMLTSYDVLTAGIFEQAGVRALLVGDTGAELVLGHDSTLPVTMAELISMTRAVVAGTRTPLVVADLPFGSYQAGPQLALANAVRHLKEGGAQAVILVWQDMAGLTAGGLPRFVKHYGDMRAGLLTAARQYVIEVGAGSYPDEAHSYA